MFYFSRFKVHRNVRPSWLLNKEGNRLELDFYLPFFNLAIEVQGIQHFEYCEMFHGDQSGFERLKRDDRHKQQICSERGIELVEITNRQQVRDLLKRLEDYLHVDSSLPPMGKGHDRVHNTIMVSNTRKEHIEGDGFGRLRYLIRKKRDIWGHFCNAESRDDLIGCIRGLRRVQQSINEELICLQEKKGLEPEQIFSESGIRTAIRKSSGGFLL